MKKRRAHLRKPQGDGMPVPVISARARPAAGGRTVASRSRDRVQLCIAQFRQYTRMQLRTLGGTHLAVAFPSLGMITPPPAAAPPAFNFATSWRSEPSTPPSPKISPEVGSKYVRVGGCKKPSIASRSWGIRVSAHLRKRYQTGWQSRSPPTRSRYNTHHGGYYGDKRPSEAG